VVDVRDYGEIADAVGLVGCLEEEFVCCGLFSFGWWWWWCGFGGGCVEGMKGGVVVVGGDGGEGMDCECVGGNGVVVVVPLEE